MKVDPFEGITASRDVFRDMVEAAAYLDGLPGVDGTVEALSHGVRIELRSRTRGDNGRFGSYSRILTITDGTTARANVVLLTARNMARTMGAE